MTASRMESLWSQNNALRGGMLIELMMSIAIAALVIPFLFRYQRDAVTRAENIAITQNMQDMQSALERYIMHNRETLMNTIGKNITRVTINDLAEFGLSDATTSASDKYQVRVLKSSDATGQATLQGVIVYTDGDISPMRTREIVSLGGGNMGFIEGTKAYGTFGAWHADTIDLGVGVTDGIVTTTNISRDNALYLWRVPSESTADATMMGPLNLGGHNIEHARFMNAASANFNETIELGRGAANSVVFQNRTTVDSNFETRNATVSGILSADSRTLEVANTLTLADIGKFTSFSAYDLWATSMTLSGISITDNGEPAILNINQTLDMTGGRIDAIYVTVGFTGSITPRLVVHNRIEDSTHPEYFWDATSSAATAYLWDATFAELNQMAQDIYITEQSAGTDASRIFGTITANGNATVADFMNAISQIQSAVRIKYSQLNLE